MRESAVLQDPVRALAAAPVRTVRFLNCMSLYVFSVASLYANRLK